MYEKIEAAIAEVQQPRSRFQLERFVTGSHATPEMRYYQTCLELQDMIYKFQVAQIGVKKAELKIKRLRETKDEMKELKAQETEIGLRQTRLAMIGAERELADLVEIFNGFDTKFTRAEIEAAQPDYWSARLTGNAKAMLMSGGGVNAAHIEAMEQAGALDRFMEEIEEQQKEIQL